MGKYINNNQLKCINRLSSNYFIIKKSVASSLINFDGVNFLFHEFH